MVVGCRKQICRERVRKVNVMMQKFEEDYEFGVEMMIGVCGKI